MLDAFFKIVLILAVAPIWLPILRSIREQMQEIEAQEREREGSGRLGSTTRFGRGVSPPTVNEDLVEETLAPGRPGAHAFRNDPSPGGLQAHTTPPERLRRAS